MHNVGLNEDHYYRRPGRKVLVFCIFKYLVIIHNFKKNWKPKMSHGGPKVWTD